MIRRVNRRDIPACAELIRRSFMTVADAFGITATNAPRFTAFAMSEERLRWHMDVEKRPMFVAEEGGALCGYCSLLIQDNGRCELNNLAVLPEYRRKGLGGQLLEHAFQTARECGCTVMSIGIVEENALLRKWYEQHGAVHTGTKKFDFFPFTCGYLERKL